MISKYSRLGRPWNIIGRWEFFENLEELQSSVVPKLWSMTVCVMKVSGTYIYLLGPDTFLITSAPWESPWNIILFLQSTLFNTQLNEYQRPKTKVTYPGLLRLLRHNHQHPVGNLPVYYVSRWQIASECHIFLDITADRPFQLLFPVPLLIKDTLEEIHLAGSMRLYAKEYDDNYCWDRDRNREPWIDFDSVQKLS